MKLSSSTARENVAATPARRTGGPRSDAADLKLAEALKEFLSWPGDTAVRFPDLNARWDAAVAFDASAYLNHNPDVGLSGQDPRSHFFDCGFKENRRFRPDGGGEDASLWRILLGSDENLDGIVTLGFDRKRELLQRAEREPLIDVLSVLLKAGPRGMFGTDFGRLVAWLGLWVGAPNVAAAAYRTYAFGLPEGSPLQPPNHTVVIYRSTPFEAADFGSFFRSKNRGVFDIRAYCANWARRLTKNRRVDVIFPRLSYLENIIIDPALSVQLTRAGPKANPYQEHNARVAGPAGISRPQALTAGDNILVLAGLPKQRLGRSVIVAFSPQETSLERSVYVLQLAASLAEQRLRRVTVLSTGLTPFEETLLASFCPHAKPQTIEGWCSVDEAVFLAEPPLPANSPLEAPIIQMAIHRLRGQPAAAMPISAGTPLFVVSKKTTCRRLHNKVVIERSLRARNFRIFDTSLTSLQEQKAVFGNSQMVVGDCSDLAGTLFCTPSTTVLAIVNPGEDLLYVILSKIAQLIGFNLRSLEAYPTSSSADGPSKADHILDVKALNLALDEIGGK